MASLKNKEFLKAVSILERNPSAISKKYKKALSELKNLKKKKQNEAEEEEKSLL